MLFASVVVMVASMIDRRFDFEFRADPAFVGYVVEITRLVLRYRGIRQCEDLLVVLTEMLRTSMQDEIGVRAGKPIRIRVELESNKRYRMVVSDWGPPLDQLRDIDLAKLKPQQTMTGLERSLSLIHTLVDDIFVSEGDYSVTVRGRFTSCFPCIHRGGVNESDFSN